jgi:HNH endonuclease
MANRSSKDHVYTPEEQAFLTEQYPVMTAKVLTAAFNERFGHDFAVTRIASRLKAWGVRSGRDCRIKKGAVAHNKGVRGVVYPGTEKTWFKPGHKPKTWRPVGSERVDVEGFVCVKVAEPNIWRFKHRVLWEQHNGPIPPDCSLVFIDGNRLNIVLENLMVLHRGVVAIANKEGRVATLAPELRAVYWQALALQHKAGVLRRAAAA